MSEAEPLSPETAEALTRLAGRVTDDAADRQELIDHLTDATLDYTSGRRRPSEADALLLVEHHLGDADRLAALIARPAGRAVSTPLARRLLAVLAATAVASVAGQAVVAVAERAAVALGLTGQMTLTVLHPVSTPVEAGLLLLLLRRWRRGEQDGVVTFYQRWSGTRLLAICATLCAVCLLMPATALPPPDLLGWTTGRRAGNPPPAALVVAVGVVGMLAYLTIGWAWLWWCDRGPRRPIVLVTAAAAWLAATYGRSELSVSWRYVYWGFPPAGGMADHQAWRLGWSMISLPPVAVACGIGSALVMSVAYAAWRRWVRPGLPSMTSGSN